MLTADTAWQEDDGVIFSSSDGTQLMPPTHRANFCLSEDAVGLRAGGETRLNLTIEVLRPLALNVERGMIRGPTLF